MAKRNDLKVVFKTYDQNQAMLLPPSLDELIAVNPRCAPSTQCWTV